MVVTIIVGLLILLMIISIIDMSAHLKRIANALEAHNGALGVYQNKQSYVAPVDNPNQHKMPGESWADFKARTGRI